MRAKYRTMVGGLGSVVVVGLLSGQEEAAVRHENKCGIWNGG